MSNIAKTEELIKIDEVNNKLADFAVKNTERYYRLAYSFVKNEDAAVDSVCEAELLPENTLILGAVLQIWTARSNKI